MTFPCETCGAALESLNTVCPDCGRWNDEVRLARPQPFTEADREYVRAMLARLRGEGKP